MSGTPSRRVDALRRARAEMTAVRERFVAAADGKSDAELLGKPANGGWCAAEILDHILTAETKLVKGLTKVAAGQKVRLPTLVWYYRLPMSIAFLPIRIEAPGPVRPHAAAEIVPKDVVPALGASRRALLALADGMGEERFARLVFPHFILGRFDGVDWFRFLARHEGRHLAQLERILGRT